MLQFTFWSLVAMLAVLAYSGRRTGNPRVGPSLVANLALVLVFSRLAGPFILTPIVTTGILLSFSSNPFIMARRWILLAWGTAAVLLPIALELTGVLPRTFEIVDGSIRITSDFYRIGGGLEEGALILANCGFILIGALFALGIGTDREQTRRKLHIQAWHLRQLLPNQQPRRTRG
jgi:hypothetical protein